MSTQLLLIDLSALAHQIWHVSGSEPDPSYVSNQIVARVRALASAHPNAAICRDTGQSFRKDLDPAYKAQRDTENRAPLKHQMDVACERLKADGFVVWGSPGYEADDIIATAVREALAIDDEVTVLIASSDKDLTQLVNDRVSMKKTTDGAILTPADVVAKFKVRPDQMLDYLCLVGDTSDNIQGAKGIGGVIAGKLLGEFGSIQAIYQAMDAGDVKARGITPALRSSLVEFRDRWPLVRSLITLKSDAPIPFAEIASERVAPPMVEDKEMDEPMREPVELRNGTPPTEREIELSGAESTAAATTAMQAVAERINAQTAKENPQLPDVPVTRSLVPVSRDQELEPRTMQDAVSLAQRMYDSRLFSAYGTPQAVLATILAGRELGLPAMASLRAFHIIEGRPTMSAGTIQSLVLKSGKATFFRCTERTDQKATFETQRGDDPPMRLTFTIEEGRRAWPKDDAAFAKSGWGKNPADMCVARAASKLARLVYPDVVAGLYAPEEFD